MLDFPSEVPPPDYETLLAAGKLQAVPLEQAKALIRDRNEGLGTNLPSAPE